MSEATAMQLDDELRQKMRGCVEALRGLRSVAVAFSGGVDSSLLTALAVETLGRENVVAVMAVSSLFPQRERRAGERLAKRLGVELLTVETPQLADATFTANPTDRCYYCKTHLLSELKAVAGRRGLGAVVTGTNASDLGDYRPGMQAEERMGARRPLLEAGLTKDDIRSVSRALDLAGWDRPSLACLASRIPYGDPITPEKLKRIEQAEDVLLGLGLSQCRVRDHGPIARVEVPLDEIGEVLAHRQELLDALRRLGYTYVALDLAGFRSGSMNEGLPRTSAPADD